MDASATAAPEAIEGPPRSSLRFSLDEARFIALAGNPALGAPGISRRIQHRFFDTEDFALARQGITLSLRKAGRNLRLELLCKGETLEAATASHVPDPAAFGPEWQATLTAALNNAPLHETASASIKQTTRELGENRLVFETGSVIARDQKIPFSEMEISGPALSLPESALALAAGPTLRLQPESLGPRAVRQAGGPPPSVHKAGQGLEGEPCLDDAVADIMRACLEQFITNWPVFYEGDEVGAVHQMRVAMRRLRSALGLFSRALPAPEFLTLRNEAKRIAASMGEARNWDVFIAMLRNGPAAAFPDEAGFAALEAQCAAHRQAGYAKVRALLEDPATTRFLLTAQALVARRGWRGALPAETLPSLAEPAKTFGARSLARLYRKLRKQGKHLASLPAQDRHQVRIDLKKLRYAAEFFGGLLESRSRVRAFNHAASVLQDELGKLNDMVTAEALAARLRADSPEATRALGIVTGWAAHAKLGNPRAIAAAWKEFRDAKPLA
ncbi:MAG: CHAD domain-containing protein [Proteobacteria bacterium]|nr:CHAD domain-containing protein [Pseudomonadota bacterium]MBU6426066.1 CHAD domain-containing protein [Rhodospirillales bacterium]